ncbi:MAG: hypothetical protein HYY37_01975 [Candidatus Aenigmarchaeota archaeon]|nr:hypothetical protein [Candidatus Aenigmarchaeota archaeon]
MQCARDDLQKGYGRHVLQGLHHAESYAAKAGIPAPADIPLLRRESYEVSVRRKIGEAHDALTLAETYAHDGGIELPEDFQQLQRRLAELAQQP